MPRKLGKLASIAAGALLLGTMAAYASDATALADRAGFLIGHAHRCGVADMRLEQQKPALDALIAAYASDDDDREAARAQFEERVLASTLAGVLGDALPSCAVVRAQLAQFEQHRLPVAPPLMRSAATTQSPRAQRTSVPVRSAWKAARSSGAK